MPDQHERICNRDTDSAHADNGAADLGLLGPTENPIPALPSTAEIDRYERLLEIEFAPQTFSERLVLRNLATRAASLRFFEEAPRALQDETDRALSMVTGTRSGVDGTGNREAPSTITTSGLLSELSRLDAVNARGFYRALRDMREIKSERAAPLLTNRDIAGNTDSNTNTNVDQELNSRFNTEQACEAYLRARFQRAQTPCRRCGRPGPGSWLQKRRCWECGNCKAQTGLRTGTVMEKSPLPLVKWFSAIRSVFLRPSITTAELAEHIGVQRSATVRAMVKRIHAAMDMQNMDTRTELLAGLGTPQASGP